MNTMLASGLAVGLLAQPGTGEAQGFPAIHAAPANGGCGIQLEVRSGTSSGQIWHSTDLVSWWVWAAFESRTTNLVHTVPASPGGAAPRHGYFKVACVPVHVPPGFLYLPPGRFLMGSPDTEPERGPDENRHPAIVSRGFWMSRTEVTLDEWRQLMPEFPTSLLTGTSGRMPANNMTWDEANEFCRRLTERDAVRGAIPQGATYRLPTETEWEYAVRAGTTTQFPFGDDPHYANLVNFGWFGDNADGGLHEVARLAPNPWGLHDVFGNVFEWCLDPDSPYPGSTRVLFDRKIRRGGSYYCPGRIVRTADRSHVLPADARDHLGGLRLVVGYAPDSLRTVELAAVPEAAVAWENGSAEATLRLTCATEGAQIEYSLQADSRSPRWLPYAGPVQLSAPASVLLRASKPAMRMSEVRRFEVAAR